MMGVRERWLGVERSGIEAWGSGEKGLSTLQHHDTLLDIGIQSQLLLPTLMVHRHYNIAQFSLFLVSHDFFTSLSIKTTFIVSFDTQYS